MKNFKILFFTLVTLWALNSAFAVKDGCVTRGENFLQNNKIKSDGEPIELKDGDTFWHYYTCSSCGSDPVSLKPRADRSQGCVNCGKPWEQHGGNEPDRLPSIFKKDGRLYLIDTKQLIDDSRELELATTKTTDENGNQSGGWSCPFCSVSNFVADSQCTSCGASWENKSELTPLLNKTHKTGSDKNNLNSNHSSYDPQTGQKSVLKEKKNKRYKATRNPRNNIRGNPSATSGIQIKSMVGGVLTISAFGGLYVGTQTFQVEGHFVGTNSAGDPIIEYYLDDKRYRAELDSHGDITTQAQWKKGDKVTLYFSNWQDYVSKELGAERGNGEVYKGKQLDQGH